jgi:AraC-like DNA-binding protein
LEHIEFIDSGHFKFEYHRKWAKGKLERYIDFCWETNFDKLLQQHPAGFADVLFPNIGYTYIINLGTPFVMQLEKTALEVKNDGFIPRHHYITCHHSSGNQLFGIKFKVCPIVFIKDVDFSEYKEHIYPLAYLIDRDVVKKIKSAGSFIERVDIIFDHYDALIDKYAGTLKYVDIVTEIITDCINKNQLNPSIEELSAKYAITNRTLQRYFGATTSFSSKQAFQTMRIRQAVINLTNSPATFKFENYGYYDYSHFLKHLQQFVGEKYFKQFKQYINQREDSI